MMLAVIRPLYVAGGSVGSGGVGLFLYDVIFRNTRRWAKSLPSARPDPKREKRIYGDLRFFEYVGIGLITVGGVLLLASLF